jgi:hypothetical protein
VMIAIAMVAMGTTGVADAGVVMEGRPRVHAGTQSGDNSTRSAMTGARAGLQTIGAAVTTLATGPGALPRQASVMSSASLLPRIRCKRTRKTASQGLTRRLGHYCMILLLPSLEAAAAEASLAHLRVPWPWGSPLRHPGRHSGDQDAAAQ